MWYIVIVSWKIDYHQYNWKTVAVYAVDTDMAISMAVSKVEPNGDWKVNVWETGLTIPREVMV